MATTQQMDFHAPVQQASTLSDDTTHRWRQYQIWRQHQMLMKGKANGSKDGSEEKKDDSEIWCSVEAQAAFLGPNLWEKTLPYDADFKLEYVDLDEFLSENSVPVDSGVGADHVVGQVGKVLSGQVGPPLTQLVNRRDRSPSPGQANQSPLSHNQVHQLQPAQLQSQQLQSQQLQPQQLQPQQQLQSQPQLQSPPPLQSPSLQSPLPLSSPSQSQEHLLSSQGSIDDSDCDTQDTEVSLSSLPGNRFDPRTRAFSDEELKPQPMIKKSRKQFVPDDLKDDKYWARRRKNNMAAKRSRDARRIKENQIALRAGYLEKENDILKAEIDRVKKENEMLRNRVSKCQECQSRDN